MAKQNRVKAKGRREKGTFLLLPHIVLKHPDFIGLPHRAARLLIDISMQYNGQNNGDLCATLSVMKKRGWTSNDQMRKAIDELLEANLIQLTKQGGRGIGPSLYAITWQSIDECKGKLDIPATKQAPRLFHQNYVVREKVQS